jgi:hypothetical protein
MVGSDNLFYGFNKEREKICYKTNQNTNKKMKILNLRTEQRNTEFGQETALVADVESVKFSDNIVWISVPEKYQNWLITDRYDGFAVALLYCAMKAGEDIYIEGAVSKKLLRNLNCSVQYVLQAFSPYLNKITIYAQKTTDSKTVATHIGTGFSGGIDSFCTVYDRFVQEKDPDYKVDTLVSFNIGHYGISDGITQQSFRDGFSLLSKFVTEVGLPYASVNTNFGWYIEKNMFWEELRQFGPLFMAAAVLSMQNRFSKYYIASNYSYRETLQYAYKDRPIKTMKSRNMIDGDYMEHILYHLLNTENLEIIVDGSQYPRTEKTKRISEYPLSYKYIDLYGRRAGKKNPVNTGKVNRTLWALESMDKLNLYVESFDIEHWKKKDAFLYKCEQIFENHSSYAQDNIVFAKANENKIPPYIVAFMVVFFYKKPLST